jgi:adenylate cyclase
LREWLDKSIGKLCSSKGYEPLRIAQRIFRWLPHDPRCKLCLNPFGGVGGKMIGFLGHKPSRKNPNVCQYCFDRLPTGGIEIDIGVVRWRASFDGSG